MQKYALVLRFGGCSVQLYGGQGTYTPTQPAFYPSAEPTTAINCLQIHTFSALKQETPKFGGVGKPSTVTLTAVDRAGALGALFNRTEEGVDTVQLASSLPAEAGTVSVVSLGAIDDAPNEGYLRCGQETFYYTSKDDATKTFTLHATAGRGALESQIREHLRDNVPARSFKPLLSWQQTTYWENRKAVLTLHKVLANGTIVAEPEEELLRGTLLRDPQPAEGGKYTFELADELSKLDRMVGAELEQTELVDGWYYSDGDRACQLDFYEMLPTDCVTGANLAQASTITAARAAGFGFAGAVVVADNSNHVACFGTARGNNSGDPAQGPLLLQIRFVGMALGNDPSGEPTAPTGYTGATQIDFASDWLPAVTAPQAAEGFCRIVQAEVLRAMDEAKRPTLALGLHEWPAAILAEFNKCCNTDTVPATAGLCYTNARISNDGTSLFAVDSGYDFDRGKPPLFGPARQAPDSRNLWYPIFREAEGDPIDSGLDQFQRLVRPWTADEANPLHVRLSSATARPVARRFEPPASAVWQGGRYAIFKDNIFSPAAPGAPGYLRAVREGAAGTLESILEYDQVVQQLNADGTFVGWRVRFTDRTLIEFDRAMVNGGTDHRWGPFGNWNTSAGSKRARIEPFAEFAGDPRRIVLEVLLSGSGTIGFPDSTFSSKARQFGVFADADAVDVPGILNFPLPAGVRDLSGFRQLKAIEAKALLTGLLEHIHAALVMVNVGGVQKISLVPVRRENAIAYAAEIADSDWLANGRPAPSRTTLETSYRFSVNWSTAEQVFKRTPTFHDADAIDKKGGAQAPLVEIGIRGLHVLSDLQLLNTVQGLKQRFGKKKLVLRGDLTWTAARALSVGQTVLVSAAEGFTSTGAVGLVRVAAEVVALGKDPIGGRCPITLLYDSTRWGVYAPVCTVTGVVSADVVTCSSAVWSAPDQFDWRWFLKDRATLPAGGIPVECVHTGEEELNTPGTITAVDSAFGRFTIIAHGLAVGDRVRPAGWAATVPHLQAFAHLLGYGAIGLGAGSDAPFKHS